MKKLLKITGITIASLLLILVVASFILESKIDSLVKQYAEENLNADLTFDDISLGLITSFPKAEVSVENLNITNRAPFANETLVTAKYFSLELPLMQLAFGGDEPLSVTEIIADEILLTLKTNKNGTANFDIMKASEEASSKDSSTKEEKNASPLKFDIKHYEINNSAFIYIDEQEHINVSITEFNHSGNGIFSETESTLETTTNTKVSLSYDAIKYLNNTSFTLDALFDLDLENQKYTFKKNKASINAMPLEFDGFVKMNDNSQHIDMHFKNPKSTFKDFLGLIPSAYAESTKEVKTNGSFSLDGVVKGDISETTIPTFDIKLLSENASFKFPQLPKGVHNIKINVEVANKTGDAKDTFVDINALNFSIGNDVFTSEAHLKDLTSNMVVDATVNGTLKLDNISKVYPVTLETPLKGNIKANINTHFDAEALEKNAYERITTSGKINLTDFSTQPSGYDKDFNISEAEIAFNTSEIKLNTFKATTGESDLSAQGEIKNLIGFVLNNQTLKGDFSLNSNKINITEFMVSNVETENTETKAEPLPEESPNTKTAENLNIPDFLDCTILAKANTVVYDNLNLKNVTGTLTIKDQTAKLTDVSSEIFNGKIGLNGKVSTKDNNPNFDLNLDLQQLDISQSFKNIGLLKAIAPIANIIQGKLNSNLSINGDLDSELSPKLNTVSGNALAQLLTSNIDKSKSPLLSGLDSQLNFIDFNQIQKDIKTKIDFKDGGVNIKPFNVNYKDIPIEISGHHSFDNAMNYKATFNVPAKYLGSDVNRLIGKIDDSEVNNIAIPINADISGTFTKPQVKTDLKSGVSNLTKQLVEIQKQKLLNKGKDKVSGLVGNLLNSKDTKNDSTQQGQKTNVKDEVKSTLKNLFGKKKKKKGN